MSKHTTFKIGGPADIWAQPDSLGPLTEIIDLCRRDCIPISVTGNGSNLLVKDKGMNGCVLNLGAGYFKDINIEDTLVTAGAGIESPRLLNALCENGLSGLESLAGIPATLGGMLVMNAGGKPSIGDFVQEVTVLDKRGSLVDLDKKEIIFRYRGSDLEKYIVVAAKLKLQKSTKQEVSKKIRECLQEKKLKQELDKPSAGCMFKNPQGDSAGRLIDASGLKGRNVGGAFVSTKHANFIINAGSAKCGDVLKLMDVIRDKVKKDHGIELEPEVKVLG